jgi:hypothetical protein
VTEQSRDAIIHAGVAYDIAAISGAGLFDPSGRGFHPFASTTACRRGFRCTYATASGTLTLDRLSINHRDADRSASPIRLEGRESAVRQDGAGSPSRDFTHEFTDVGLIVRFTGGLIIGRDVGRELLAYRALHPAWRYRVVLEILVDDGAITAAVDVSERMADIRRRAAAIDASGAGEAEIRSWIGQCFSRRYPA